MSTLRIYAVLSNPDGEFLSTLTYKKDDDALSVLKITGDSALMMNRMSVFERDCHGDSLTTNLTLTKFHDI